MQSCLSVRFFFYQNDLFLNLFHFNLIFTLTLYFFFISAYTFKGFHSWRTRWPVAHMGAGTGRSVELMGICWFLNIRHSQPSHYYH